MKNASLILNFLVVLLITKLKGSTYEPTQKLSQEDSLPNSSTEVEKNIEPLVEMVLMDVSLHSQKVDLDTKPRKKASDPEVKHKNHNKDQTNASDDLEAPSNEEFESLDSHEQVDVINQYMDYYTELENSLNDLDSKLKWYDSNLNHPEEISDYKEDLVDYYEELIHILGTQYEEVEVLLKQDKIEIAEKDQVEMNEPANFSLKKSKLYAVHPYQIKSEKTPPSMNGPIMYLSTEEEDKSSPLRYYQQYGRKSNPQYSYIPKKKDQLLKLFPGLSSESKSNNQPLKTKTKFQHDTVKKGSSSKIALERMNTGWPFGYDLTQKPSEYSIMHKVNLNLHPKLALMKQEGA